MPPPGPLLPTQLCLPQPLGRRLALSPLYAPFPLLLIAAATDKLHQNFDRAAHAAARFSFYFGAA